MTWDFYGSTTIFGVPNGTLEHYVKKNAQAQMLVLMRRKYCKSFYGLRLKVIKINWSTKIIFKSSSAFRMNTTLIQLKYSLFLGIIP